MSVLITGANRGIGLALARIYAQRGEDVFATARNPQKAEGLQGIAKDYRGKVHVLSLDVTEPSSCDALGKELASTPLDIVVNNAGVMGAYSSLPDTDLEDVRRTFETNALGLLRVTKSLFQTLADSRSKLVQVTSQMGSIADNSSGKAYGYRMSKAALNMATKNLALELGERGCIVVALHPGWVQTDMGGANAPTPVDTAASKIVEIIARLTPGDNGKFVSASNGKELPW